jgi:hypothetical protein
MKSNLKITLKKIAHIYCPRFGEIAVELGFITVEQLKEALSEQVDNYFVHKPFRLLGEIFLDKGWMTIKQIEIVLHKYVKHEKLSKGTSKRRTNKITA